jgi:hypothetical protein
MQMRSDLDDIRERQVLRETREELSARRDHWGWARLFLQMVRPGPEERLATAEELHSLTLRPGTPQGGF